MASTDANTRQEVPHSERLNRTRLIRRPAAFVVVERDGEIAVVKVSFEGGARRLICRVAGSIGPRHLSRPPLRDAPGGGAGGVVAEPDRADHYFINQDGSAVNTRGVFFAGPCCRGAS